MRLMPCRALLLLDPGMSVAQTCGGPFSGFGDGFKAETIARGTNARTGDRFSAPAREHAVGDIDGSLGADTRALLDAL